VSFFSTDTTELFSELDEYATAESVLTVARDGSGLTGGVSGAGATAPASGAAGIAAAFGCVVSVFGCVDEELRAGFTTLPGVLAAGLTDDASAAVTRVLPPEIT